MLLLLAAAIAVANWGSPTRDSLQFELQKQLIQLLLLGALGALVRIFIDSIREQAATRNRQIEYEKDVDNRQIEYEKDIVTSLLSRLDRIYRQLKLSRQRLGFGQIYDETASREMWKVRNLGDDLEQLTRDVQLHDDTIGGLEGLADKVGTLDKYVGACWTEYKSSHADVSPSSPLPFGERLSKFVAEPRPPQGDFQNFDYTYRDARTQLARLLIPGPGRVVGATDAGSNSAENAHSQPAAPRPPSLPSTPG